jgi:uncharacterized spore protein YtfJ
MASSNNNNSKPAGSSTQITNVVHSLLDGLHSMSKSETVVGDPYTLGDATIVPVHRLRVALGAGAVHGGVKQDASSGESGGLGAGGAVQIEPVAVIAVGKDGIPRIMCVENEGDNAAKKIMDQLPDTMGNVLKLLAERVGPLFNKIGKTPTATAVTTAARNALPEGAKALLPGGNNDGET